MILRAIRRARSGIRRLAGRLSRGLGRGSDGAAVRSSARRRRTPSGDRLLVDALLAEAAQPARTSGPLVSIVMLNRNGVDLLRLTLPALARTAYAPVELIVVDNGSTDGSRRLLESFDAPFPVTVVQNTENRSFSEANNQGVEASRGELLLFLNNDVEPVGPQWLGPLVDAIADPLVGAAGARLVYPSGMPGPRAGAAYADLTVQHAGVQFKVVDGMPLGTPIGAGDDPTSPAARATRGAPALTAACLLVRAAAFRACGGFTVGYDYGQEDVDLCLKLRERGWQLIYEGRSILWHHESATRWRGDRNARDARIRSNRARFTATWGPRLYRTTMRSAIAGDRAWRDPLRLHLIPSPGREPVAIPVPSDRGWRVTVGPPDPDGRLGVDADVVVVADPARDVRALAPGIVRLAWLGDQPADWSDASSVEDFDLLLIPDGARARLPAGPAFTSHGLEPMVVGSAAALADALTGWVDARRATLRVGIPGWKTAHTWGDLHFSRDLARALRRQGMPTRIDLRPAWTAPAAARDDVAIHLFGFEPAPTHAGQLNVLWHISHPDLATPDLYERYDVVFVASAPFAARMQGQVRVPVKPLNQAADPQRFAPRPGGRPHALLFVANSRGVRRHILDDLLPTPHELAVYGRRWTPDLLDPRHLRGEHVPNDELAACYAAAGIVLNDHWPDMQREGFISNRIYDASAAGAFVISDAVDGLADEFDGGVVAYRAPAELSALVNRFLGDPGARAEHAARARAAVLERHTFDHRAREILTVVGTLRDERPEAIEIPPGRYDDDHAG